MIEALTLISIATLIAVITTLITAAFTLRSARRSMNEHATLREMLGQTLPSLAEHLERERQGRLEAQQRVQ